MLILTSSITKLHEKNCDSSINVLRYLYEEETPKQPKHEEAQIANVACSSTENWDDVGIL